MSTVLLAVAGEDLAGALERLLQAGGHAVMRAPRALALLGLARSTTWDVAIVDASTVGMDAHTVLSGAGHTGTPVIGIAATDERLTRRLDLPVDAQALLASVEALTRRAASTLVLRSDGRVAQANGREVALTRTEFRLLERLLALAPDELTIAEAREAVWGRPAADESSVPLRSHMRNLRLKLRQIGLAESVQSRRGRGYALALDGAVCIA